jgi:ElaA protein
MELFIRKFSDLTVTELFEIYQLRESVFIVEQQCAYQDVDDYDLSAVHVFLKEDGMIQAYLRVLPRNTKFDEVSLGRIIAKKRLCGLGRSIVAEGIKAAGDYFKADSIVIGAQIQAVSFMKSKGSFRSQRSFWKMIFLTSK